MKTDNDTIREQYERETGHPYQRGESHGDTGLLLMDVFWISVCVLIVAAVLFSAVALANGG